MKGPSDLRHEDAAGLGYRNELDPQLAEHADAITHGIEPLILAFRQWCLRRGYAEPTIEQFREMLLEAAEIRADLASKQIARWHEPRETLAQELLDAVRGVLEFERVNSVIAGPYDRLRIAYNAVIREADHATTT